MRFAFFAIQLLALLHCHTASAFSSGRESSREILEKRGAEIYARYRERLSQNPQPVRQVIYTCEPTPKRGCGGLGDRLKGFVSTFVLALLLDADFKAYWEDAVPLRAVFHVREDTLLNLTQARQLARNASEFVLLNQHIHAVAMHRMRKVSFHEEFRGNTSLFVRLDGALWDHISMNDHLYPAAEQYGLHKLSKRQVFELVLRLFFSQPTAELAAATNKAVHQRAGLRVGVQIRIGGEQLLDPLRYEGSSVAAATECFVKQTLGVCRRKCSVFLTSDNGEAQALFRAAMAGHSIPVAVNEGANLHLEHSEGNASEHMKSFGDWLTLTQMHFLVISRSGFGETASWFGNVPAVTLVQASPCLFTAGPELPTGTDP